MSTEVSSKFHPIRAPIPYDVMDAIIHALDWETLLTFNILSHASNEETNHRVWRAVNIDSGSSLRRVVEGCEAIARLPTRARNIRSLRIDAGGNVPLRKEHDAIAVATERALQCTPRLRSLRLHVSQGMCPVLEMLAKNQFPFRLEHVGLGSANPVKRRAFLESHPSIVSFESDDFYDAGLTLSDGGLPNLRSLRGSIPNIIQLMPGRPIETLDMTGSFGRDDPKGPLFRQALSDAVTPIKAIRLPIRDLVMIPPLISYIEPAFPHLRSLGLCALYGNMEGIVSAFIPSLPSLLSLEELECRSIAMQKQGPTSQANRRDVALACIEASRTLRQVVFTLQSGTGLVTETFKRVQPSEASPDGIVLILGRRALVGFNQCAVYPPPSRWGIDLKDL